MGGACSVYGGEEWRIQDLGGGENLSEKIHLVHPSLYGKIILRWIFRKLCRWAWTRLNWFRIGTGSGVL